MPKLPKLPNAINVSFNRSFVQAVQSFFDACHENETTDPLSIVDGNGQSILFMSVSWNDPDGLKTCLTNISNYYGDDAANQVASARDNRGHTPLFIAARSKKAEMIKALCVAGVDPNVQAQTELISSDRTALHEAVAGSAASVTIPVLLELGANPSLHDAHGNNPLHEAVCNYHSKAIEVMLGYFEKKISEYSDSPDLIASDQQCLDEIDQCMAMQNEDGQTPLAAMSAKIKELQNRLGVDVPDGASPRLIEAIDSDSQKESLKEALQQSTVLQKRMDSFVTKLQDCLHNASLNRSRSSSANTSCESFSSDDTVPSNPKK